jgi:hypothetical protein
MPTFKNLSVKILSMVRIRSDVTKEGIAALMIDGYAPEPQEFEALPWAKMWKDESIDYREWLNEIRVHQRRIKEHYSESTYLTAYRNAITALMCGFCYSKTEERPMSNLPGSFCLYRGFTTGHTSGSIESSSPSHFISPSVRKAQLQILQNEYRHDERQERHHYVQNVIMYVNNPNLWCSETARCSDNWIRTLHFQEKAPSDYVDVDGFIQSWSELLMDITHLHPKCSFYYPLYERLGINYLEGTC